MKAAYRVVLADDHPLLRKGLKRILGDRKDIRVVGEANDGIELLDLLKKVAPHLVILDISMPRLRGLEAIREIQSIRPDLRILILTMHREFLHQAMAQGANGYLMKDNALDELFTAIDAIRDGRTYISPLFSTQVESDWVQACRGKTPIASQEPLTTREREVLKLMCDGKSSREIAELLFVSLRTVEHHRTNMMEKLKLKKTIDLIKYGISKGYAE
jgi:DNA-binding NarL/FixJ family response regulator